MFINIPLRDCECGVFQDVQESLGIKGHGKAKMGLSSQPWEDTIHAERTTYVSAPHSQQGQEPRTPLLVQTTYFH